MTEVMILDLGGENNQVTARLVRQMGMYCKVYHEENLAEALNNNPHAAIIIGNHDNYKLNANIPVLDLTGNETDADAIRAFLFDDCKLAPNWSMKQFTEENIEAIRAKVGNGKALLALSGGVDSTVCAVLMHRAIGANLTCVFVDTGLMRLNEPQEVVNVFKEQYGINVIKVDAEARFLAKLAGVTDPEQKRKIIGEEFIRVFEEEAKKIGHVEFFVQGTIYPDIIESGTKVHKVIKSHHNVGGMPDVVDFDEILEPLKDLFKDEVRAVGLELGIPKALVFRQPFPGPGLGVRVIGELTKEKLDILRQADFIYRRAIERSGVQCWQYFCILTGLRSVGIKDGARSYGYTIALRAINTVDAMTAEIVELPYKLLAEIVKEITDNVPEVTRVVYDITPKAPATIEWE